MKPNSKCTPWGTAQDYYPFLGSKLFHVSTARHGGVWVPEDLNKRIPEKFRSPHGWYEEDCHCCILPLFLPELFSETSKSQVESTVKNWYPEVWELVTGTVLPLSESHKKREAAFYLEHKDSLIVHCAFGDWHEKVPKGFVGVAARIGCFSSSGPSRYFLVPAEEYKTRSSFGFVIDLTKHTEVPAL